MSAVGYPLKDLVMVREVRETSASREVSVAQNNLDAARIAVIRAQDEFDAYVKWRVEEEKRSYEKILNKKVSLAKLEELKQEIRGLRERESDHQQAILDAEKHVSECENALLAAQTAHREAMRGLQKLEEHREVWDTEQALVLERKEEDEMDDFRVAPAITIGK